MTVQTGSADWTRARRKPEDGQTFSDLPDKFAGGSSCHRGKIDSVPISLCRAWTSDDAAPPATPAVVLEPEWSASKRSDLPLGLHWKQVLSGRFEFEFDLPAKVRCLGLGERFSALDLRGATHTLLATDNSDHNESADALYKAIPFLLLYNGDQSHAIFLDSPAPQIWELDTEFQQIGRISLLSRRGWRLYILGPASAPNLVAAYTTLTGRATQPPRWALGHFQSRWSYPDEPTLRQLAVEFRARQIPCDTLVLDIDYMDEYKVFTMSHERFPRFGAMISDLSASNFKLVTIVDPGVKRDNGFPLYKEGERRDMFCRKADGSLFTEQVWPGLSVFPDFLKEATRSWWGEKLKFYTDQGIAGIWNDMNEPAFFGIKQPLNPAAVELPEEQDQLFVHETETGPVGHLEVRNLYGMEMCRATSDGLLKHRPDERPFVLTRAAYAGIQRYAAVWLGDNNSWYEHLRKAVPMLLNMGMSGCAFCGVDIGGFGGHTTPELLVRWYEQGIFYPFFRNHSMMESRSQEPWMFGDAIESKIRHLIETRYRLLPYIETLFYEHRLTGAPLMRPMLWHYPEDKIVGDISDQFMFGKDILVAPVVERSTHTRPVYFPAGRWHPFEGGEVVQGPGYHAINLELGKVPAFAREGAIIPLASIMQSTAEYTGTEVCFHVFGDTAFGAFYEDDGHSFACNRGAFNHWNLTFEEGIFTSTCSRDGYEGYTRQYRVKTHSSEAPVELSLLENDY